MAIPPCLKSRYKALHQLMADLNESKIGDPGIKMMCSIWKAMQEEAVSHQSSEYAQLPHTEQPYSQTYSTRYYSQPYHIYATTGDTSCSLSPGSVPPLSGALNSLQKAADFDQSCNDKLKNLIQVENTLKEQISKLEEKEQIGVNLLREADAMWKGMEDTYKEKIAESLKRQVTLANQLQEIEKSAAKWRKNKKELESQLDTINNCQREIVDKINKKKNDLKTIEADLVSIKKKMDNTQQEIEGAKKALLQKKKQSDGYLSKITAGFKTIQAAVTKEDQKKAARDAEAKDFIKSARDDLQQLCKVLMQKQLEVEDRCAEKNAVIEECNVLKDTADMCQERCKKKESQLIEELNKVNKEIATMRLKCERCNVCIDAEDIRKYCVDCPRCAALRLCVIQGEKSCVADPDEECVCLPVKQKLIDNVFENMYIVLAKRISTPPGKAIADNVLDCLKQSRNGKLDLKTKQAVKDFILIHVKKNMNLSIVGGAIKTRCEMDDGTHKQLMLCLKTVKVTKFPKVEVGTDPKKPPCTRWPESSECNCPKGPKNCVCMRKAPPAIDDPAYFPPEPVEEENAKIMCPVHKKTVCGTDCAAHTAATIATEVANKTRPPCYGGAGTSTAAAPSTEKCTGTTRAAQVTSDQCVCGKSEKDMSIWSQDQQCAFLKTEVYGGCRQMRYNKVDRASNITEDLVIIASNQNKPCLIHGESDHDQYYTRPYSEWENVKIPKTFNVNMNYAILLDKDNSKKRCTFKTVHSNTTWKPNDKLCLIDYKNTSEKKNESTSSLRVIENHSLHNRTPNNFKRKVNIAVDTFSKTVKKQANIDFTSNQILLKVDFHGENPTKHIKSFNDKYEIERKKILSNIKSKKMRQKNSLPDYRISVLNKPTQATQPKNCDNNMSKIERNETEVKLTELYKGKIKMCNVVPGKRICKPAAQDCEQNLKIKICNVVPENRKCKLAAQDCEQNLKIKTCNLVPAESKCKLATQDCEQNLKTGNQCYIEMYDTVSTLNQNLCSDYTFCVPSRESPAL